MQKDPPDIENVRRIVGAALGDSRLTGTGPDVPLVRSGIITSIESVLVQLELEREYGRSELESLMTPADWTLRRIAMMVGGDGDGVATVPAGAPAFGSMKRAARRPLLSVAAILAWLLAFNAGVTHAFGSLLADRYDAFIEHGARLYPLSGAFSHDDFRFALRHHAVSRPAAPGEERILMFGDSGTIGSFVRADEAIPAETERALRASVPSARVLNLAWYGRVLAKDFMLLESVWNTPASAVVFTIGDEYFSRTSVDRWLRQYRHVSLNVPLLDAFLARVPSERRECFAETAAILREADRQNWGRLRRWSFDNISILRYRPFLQHEWYVRTLPPFVGSSLRAQATTFRDFRYAEALSLPQRVVAGITADDFDSRQECMLATVLTMLESRGVRTVLYVEPLAPASWIVRQPGRMTAIEIARQIAASTGSEVVDLTAALAVPDFLDSPAHYTPAANRLIGERIARALLTRHAAQ